jgi:hypothetical protein
MGVTHSGTGTAGATIGVVGGVPSQLAGPHNPWSVLLLAHTGEPAMPSVS